MTRATDGDKKLRRFCVPPEHVQQYALGRAIPGRMHACRADSASPGLIVSGRSPAGNDEKSRSGNDGDHTRKEAANDLNQGRPVRSVRGLTEASGDERLERAERHRNLWDTLIP